MTTKINCPHAWASGLQFGLLHECKYPEKHSGRHSNVEGNIAWTGKLNDDEMDLADALRAAQESPPGEGDCDALARAFFRERAGYDYDADSKDDRPLWSSSLAFATAFASSVSLGPVTRRRGTA